MKIVIITPVRNEEQYISVTINCMLKQTILPIEWIIVDDGSTDNTGTIIKNQIQGHSFIKYVSLKDRGFRKPGKGVVETFYEGYKRIENRDYDILAKFDGDLEFPTNTLEEVSKAFNSDPRLGVTGGTRYERSRIKGSLKKVIVPKGFVGGPFKFYRRKCFEDINGLIKRAGWDGVDTVKANMKCWRTGEIESLKILHLQPTGTSIGEGLIKACEKYGDVSYYMGGYFWYFLLRAIGRSLESRNPKVGYYMISGYLKSRNNNEAREQGDFRMFLKKNQIQNVRNWVKLLFGFRMVNN